MFLLKSFKKDSDIAFNDDSLVEDIEEDSMSVLYYENEYKNLLLDNILSEDDSKTGFFEKMKEFFKKIVTTITNMTKDILQKINIKNKSIEKFIKENESEISRGINSLDSESKEMKDYDSAFNALKFPDSISLDDIKSKVDEASNILSTKKVTVDYNDIINGLSNSSKDINESKKYAQSLISKAKEGQVMSEKGLHSSSDEQDKIKRDSSELNKIIGSLRIAQNMRISIINQRTSSLMSIAKKAIAVNKDK